MFRLKLFIIVVLLIGRKDSLGQELRSQNRDGFGYELIQSRLDLLELRFSERFDQLKKQTERVEVSQQQLNGNVEQNITQLVKGVEVALGKKVSLITEQISKLQDRLPNPAGCSELPKTTSGLCFANIAGNKTLVYQVHRFDVDWLTVLQRSDGSENFDRNWTDYRDGFGTAGQEYWLGLERLHVLTKNDSYELLVELEDFDGKYTYARYDKFSIGAEQDLYRLNVLGTYSGTAADSLKYHKGYQFSALDKGPRQNCVEEHTGGWWYRNCYWCRLTGKWQREETTISIVWDFVNSKQAIPLKFARMLIRKI